MRATVRPVQLDAIVFPIGVGREMGGIGIEHVRIEPDASSYGLLEVADLPPQGGLQLRVR